MTRKNYIIIFFSFALISLLPFTLITGPAIPDISIVLVCLFFLIYLFINREFKIFEKNLVIFTLVFWILLILLNFNSIQAKKSFLETLVFIRILLIPIIIYYWILTKNKFILFSLSVIFFSNILVIFDSIYQFLNYDPILGFKEDFFKRNSDIFYGRLSGPFLDLVPGSYIAKFFIFGFVFLVLTIKKNKRLFLFISIIYLTLCGLITFISGEKMALATFLLGMLLCIIFLKYYRLLFFTSLALFLLVSGVIYNYHDHYQNFKIIDSQPSHLGLTIEKYNNKCNNNLNCSKVIKVQPELMVVLKNFSQSAYGNTFSLAIEMFKAKPLTGIGINNFEYGCENIKNFKRETCWSHPHNFYLQWLAETGILGLLFFVIYIIIIFKIILIENKDSKYKFFSVIALVILFWPIMSTGSLFKNWHGIQTFFVLGMSLSLLNIKKVKNN